MLPWILPLLLTGCAARRAGDAVGKVDFVFPRGENGPVRLGRRPTQRAIRNAMAHPQPRWQAFLVPGLVEPAWIDRDLLDEDAWRLEVWYANQGYFDARFLGWEILPKGNQRKALRRHLVRGHVDEGEPSKIRAITTQGIEKLGRPLKSRIGKILGGGVGAEVDSGDVFTYADWQDALDELRALLGERSYAHARVDGEVAVYPDEHAVDLSVTIDHGPFSEFGPVTIEGLRKVPEHLVRAQVTIEPGKPWRASELQKTRAKLYALRVFGVVDVIPDLSDPTSPVVPVRIRVTEAKARELRAGPVLQVEPGKSSIALQAAYRDENVANRLWRTKHEATVGVGAIVDTVDALADVEADDVEPIVELASGLEIPRLAGTQWSLLTEGRLELGLERGYRFFEPSVSPTLLYRGIDRLTPSFGYRLQYTDYFDLTVDVEDIEDSRLGLDLTDPYLLSMLEQRVVYDRRNDPLNTTRGWYGDLALAEAGLGGNYQFLRLKAELRAYRGIVNLFGWDPDVVFAGRLGGGIIRPYGEGSEAAVPYAERLYLGGSTTVRGWGANRLGPWICVDPEEGDTGTCETNTDLQVPAGGELQLFGNFEVRKGLPLDLTLALFVDAGRVWDRPENVGFGELQWTVGGGLRYATPVGPVRLDLGVRLGDPAYFAAHSRWGLHLALGEAF